jgi:hypothetical protein
MLSTELQDVRHSNESLEQAVSVLKYEVSLMVWKEVTVIQKFFQF